MGQPQVLEYARKWKQKAEGKPGKTLRTELLAAIMDCVITLENMPADAQPEAGQQPEKAKSADNVFPG
jgi:hypothetical protein